MNIIKTENLTKIYNIFTKAPVNALKGVSIEIEKGEMVAIQGPSGCGKSTLLHILGCVDYPNKGKYILDDKEVEFGNNTKIAEIRNKKIGFVLQQYGLIGERKVYDNVVLPLIFANKNLKKEDKHVDALLDKLGILHLKNTTCDNLSGGERQRTAIARALINSPDIILADEPTGALDSANGQACMDLFKNLNKEGITIVMVTHDSNLASQCKRIIYLKDGVVVSANTIIYPNY